MAGKSASVGAIPGVVVKNVTAALAMTLVILAADRAGAQQEVLLWPDGAPLATGSAATDKPGLTPFPAAGRNTGAAVVIFPGGAYVGLSFDKEGTLVAQWLQGRGISAFVVKYRLGSNNYHHPAEMWDGQRAIRWVRSNAAKYGVDTARVGVLGFSAGGHLAATVSTHYDAGNPAASDSVDRQGCRPAFSILGYPVITLERAYTHIQSRDNVLGPNPGQALIDSLSNEKQVTADTPPAFLFHSTDDNVVQIKNPVMYRDSLKKRGVEASLMIFNHGGHGFGMADGKAGAPDDAQLHAWCDSSLKWLDARGFLVAKPTAIAAPGARLGISASPIAPAARDPLLRMPLPDGGAADALGRRPGISTAPAAPPAGMERR